MTDMIFSQSPNFDNSQQQSVDQESNNIIIEKKCTISLKKSVQNSHLGLSHYRKYIKKKEIAVIAEKKYRENGLAITFKDVMKELRVSKHRAQRMLKYSHREEILFTAQDLVMEGIKIKGIKRESPQCYYPIDLKSQFIENRKKNVLNDTTGPGLDFIDIQKIQYVNDWMVKLSPRALDIHKLQIMTSIDKENYELLSTLNSSQGSHYRSHYEKIGQVKGHHNVEYRIYSNGTVMIYVSCSENPFRLQYEEDISAIMIFLGKVDIDYDICFQIQERR